MLKNNKRRGAEAERQREETYPRERGRVSQRPLPGFTVVHDLVVHRRRDEAADCRQQQEKAAALNELASSGHLRKQLLKHALKLKAKQHLSPKNEEARFI